MMQYTLIPTEKSYNARPGQVEKGQMLLGQRILGPSFRPRGGSRALGCPRVVFFWIGTALMHGRGAFLGDGKG
jgi:hypothetical protein